MRKLLTLALAAGLPLAAALVVPITIQQAQAAAKPAKAAKADLVAGKKVYETNCASCHGSLAMQKPTLPNAGNFFSGNLPRTKGNLADMEKIIKVGGAGYGKGASPAMPAWPQLSAKDIANVAAFEKSLHK